MPVYYYGSGVAKERLQYFLDNPPPAIAVDVETISLKERIPLGFAIAFSPDEAIYFQLYPEPPKELELLRPLLCNPEVRKVAHNMMFDLSILPMIPYLNDVDRSNIWDTNIAARLLGRDITDLPFLARTELEMSVTAAKDMLGPGKTMLDIDKVELADKCIKDARACFMLYVKYLPQIESQHVANFAVDMAVMPILIDMSQKGLKIDKLARDELADKYTKEIEFYYQQLVAFGVDKPSSNQQVGLILAKRGNFLPFTKSRKQLSTREGDLEFLDDPMAAAVLGFRQCSKFNNTYLKPLEGQDYFYTEYYLDTLVGRMNSRNRNIQNIPLDARYMILPDRGCFTSMDYAKEHMFILANMSGDRDMLRVLYDPDPVKNDIHQHTASRMGISRRIAKVVNYSIPYGGTAKTIQENGKIRDIRLCERLLEDWFRAYPGTADWITHAQREGLRDGWALPTLFGRRIKLPAEREDSQRRKAVNYPILGSDGEIIKRAILLCKNKDLGPPILSIAVHDSLDFDGDVELPKDELEMLPGFRIPIGVKKTLRWE